MHGQSKYNGGLFTLVKNAEGKNKKYIHIGDNPDADINQAKKSSFSTYYYKNINSAGKNIVQRICPQ